LADRSTSSPARVEVLGLPLDLVDLEEAVQRLESFLLTPTLDSVVTLNPEIVVRAQADPGLKQAIHEASLVTPDGVGMLWAVRALYGLELKERVTGIELAEAFLAKKGKAIRVFFLGARPGVAERAAAYARTRFGVRIAGTHHGYFKDEEEAVRAVRAVRQAAPDLLLVALGERQEKFIARHKERLAARIAIGVGGTLDVWAGVARRAPVLTRRLGLEWAWRVGLDPRRWRRGLRLLRFVYLVRRAKR